MRTSSSRVLIKDQLTLSFRLRTLDLDLIRTCPPVPHAEDPTTIADAGRQVAQIIYG